MWISMPVGVCTNQATSADLSYIRCLADNTDLVQWECHRQSSCKLPVLSFQMLAGVSFVCPTNADYDYYLEAFYNCLETSRFIVHFT